MKTVKRPRMLNEEKESSWFVIPLAVLFVLLIVIAVFDAWLNANYFGVYVSGDSMCDTVEDGDFVYARERKAERGDVIIIDVRNYREHDHLTGDYIIKRLIATQGDSIYCEDGAVYLKCAGEEEYVRLDEEYAKGLTTDFKEVTVGEGEIFFLGDNRLVSYDSRRLGCYKVIDIAGVVPDWAIKHKSITTGWEKFRSSVTEIFN